MDNSNWRPTQAEPNMDATDWRTTLQPDSRQRIVNKIMETLKRHLPISGPEGLVELSKIATRFEEKIYTAGTSQSDYLRKISMKMLTMETKSQTSMANNIQLNSAGSAQNPPDPAHSMQSLVRNQGQSQIPLPDQSQAREQLLSQNVQNTITNTGVQSSASLPSNSDVISQNPAVEEKMPAYEKQLIGILNSNRHRQPTHHTELLSAQTIKSISNTTMFKPEYLEQQKQQLEQQFQEWQMYQQWINQQMQHVLQQQEQILQEQQQ